MSTHPTCPKCGKVIVYRGPKPELLEHFIGDDGQATHCFPSPVWQEMYGRKKKRRR